MRSLSLAATGLGLASTGAQVFLLRDLLVSAAGDEASIGIGFSSWLCGIAVGAILARRLSPDRASRLSPLLLAAVSLSGGSAAILGRLLRGAFAPPQESFPASASRSSSQGRRFSRPGFSWDPPLQL